MITCCHCRKWKHQRVPKYQRDSENKCYFCLNCYADSLHCTNESSFVFNVSSLHGDMTFQAVHVGVSGLLISSGRISLLWSQWSAVTSWKAALGPDEETSITAKEPPKISQDTRRQKNSSNFDDLVYANIHTLMHLFCFAVWFIAF